MFDFNSDKIQKHMNVECNPEHIEIMWNNGYAPKVIHSGSLGVESVNSMIKKFSYFLT